MHLTSLYKSYDRALCLISKIFNMKNQFYVTLPSNTEKNSSASNFSIRMPHRIRLEGDWEVGLAEFIYPNSWYNVSKGENYVHVQFDARTLDIFTDYPQASSNTVDGVNVNPFPKEYKLSKAIETVYDHATVKPSYYKTVQDLVYAMNTALKDRGQHYPEYTEPDFLYFDVDTLSSQVVLTVNPSIVKEVRLSKDLATALGFESEQIYFKRPSDISVLKRFAKYKDGLEKHFQSMYIYCSVIEDQIVGNMVAPLLRIVDVQGDFKQIINRTFDSPHYVPVLQKDINRIEMNIKDDLNRFISFEFGKVVIKLHFKRCSLII